MLLSESKEKGDFMEDEKGMQDLKILGENILFLQNKRNIGNKEFSKEIKYDRNDFAKLVLGEKNIQLSTAVKLAKHFNVSLSMLFNNSFRDDSGTREKSVFIDEDFHYIFAENVKMVMKKRQIPQSTISMDPASVTRILNYQIKDPCIKTLSVIAQAVHMSLSELFKIQYKKEN